MKIMEKFFGRRLNAKGQEVPDPTPVEMPLGYRAPLPLDVRMKQMIRDEMSSHAQHLGYETWEEANDFNVGDGEESGLFPDEDEDVSPNDPFIERALREQASIVKEENKNIKENISSNLGTNVLGDSGNLENKNKLKKESE